MVDSPAAVEAAVEAAVARVAMLTTKIMTASETVVGRLADGMRCDK